MKKYIKKTVLLVLALCVMLSLCSCIQLDDLKSVQAFEISDYELQYKDKTYIKLAEEGIITIDMHVDDGTFYNCRVTKEDVPVLLSRTLGSYALVDEKKGIIDYNNAYYAREDVYPSLKKTIDNREFTKLVAQFDAYDENFNYYIETYEFTKQEEKVINNILKSTKTLVAEEVDIYSYNWEFDAYKSDDSVIIKEYAFSLYSNPEKEEYYLVYTNDTYNSMPEIHQVPKKYNEMFKNIAVLSEDDI